MSYSTALGQTVWDLPPLILHPFSDERGPNKLVESSRASLMMQGLLPSGHLTPEQLTAYRLRKLAPAVSMLKPSTEMQK